MNRHRQFEASPRLALLQRELDRFLPLFAERPDIERVLVSCNREG